MLTFFTKKVNIWWFYFKISKYNKKNYFGLFSIFLFRFLLFCSQIFLFFIGKKDFITEANPFFFVFRIRLVKFFHLECEILLSDFDFEKNASGVVTSYDVEKIYARKIDDLKKIYSNKSLANSIRKYLDCTVHVQVKPLERVSKKSFFD